MNEILLKDSKKELQLFHFTLENLHEAVFWVTSKGKIYQANDMACQMTGYTKEELGRMHVVDINPSRLISEFTKFWKRLKVEKKITFETQHKHKSGYSYDVEVTGNYIDFEGQEFTCTIVRDIRKRKIEEELLLTVSE